jgi:hypothetical protein
MDRSVDHEPPPVARVPRDVLLWRRDLLTAAGFCDELARQLAGDPAYDLHGLLTLVDRGCPPHLAARILAPL